MNKKSKLLKIRTQKAAYLTVIAAVMSFSGHLSAGFVRDDVNPDQANPRTIQVVLGNQNGTVAAHPRNQNPFGAAVPLGDDNVVKTYMQNIAPIRHPTQVQFWVSNDNHRRHALFGAAGAQENAYKHAILAAITNGQPIVPANVTFTLNQIP